MAEQIDGLDDDNREAWRIYGRAVGRFLVDAQAVAFVLERLTRDLALDEFDDLMRRLVILYDALCPPKEPKAG